MDVDDEGSEEEDSEVSFECDLEQFIVGLLSRSFQFGDSLGKGTSRIHVLPRGKGRRKLGEGAGKTFPLLQGSAAYL